MNNCNQDMDVLEFARRISRLSIDTPLANKYDEEYGQRSDRWWSCQREHLTVFAEALTPKIPSAACWNI